MPRVDPFKHNDARRYIASLVRKQSAGLENFCHRPAELLPCGISLPFMHENEKLIHQFYTAFQHKDYVSMQGAYHPDASFSDPVFQDLKSHEVKAMWEMLITAGKDLKITFRDIKANDMLGSCRWEAWYTFSRTGRKVHNIITATFEFQDGRILKHHDSFNFWRWSHQALGMTGFFLGWTSVLQEKIRVTARHSLEKYLKRGER